MNNTQITQIFIESIVVALPLFMIIRTFVMRGRNLLDD